MNLQRRALLAGMLALGAAATPLARAQPAGKVYRVAWFLTTSPLAELQGPEPAHPITRAFVQELRALGYVEGRNLVLERRSAEGDPGRYAPILAELIALKTDIIVLPGQLPLNRLAKKMTKTIPIVVFGMAGSPVDSGLVDSLAHPAGNITGTTVSSGPENEAKRLELLKEAVPGIVRVAYLGTREAWDNSVGQSVRRSASSLGVQLLHAEHRPDDLEATFAIILRERPDALFASIGAETYAQRQQIVGFARRLRLPGVYPYVEMAAMGGLMAYGVDVVDLGRQAADCVDKILKGAKPGDLPVERPTKFNLVLNTKTAKALGITIPQSLLLRADEVIQ